MNESRTATSRRRSDRALQAIHQATRDLVCELGYSKVTIEAIAARAGVGKQTIYRWWPSKCAVVLDVLVADSYRADGSALANTGELITDLRSMLVETVRYLTDHSNDNLLRAMTAEMQYDDELAATVLDQLFRPHFDELVVRLRDAQLTSPIGAPADPELAAELLVGPIFHRWLLRRAPLDEQYVHRLIDRVLGSPASPSTTQAPQARPKRRTRSR